jgi:hypothetical protein
MCSRSSAGMPGPWSVTTMRASDPVVATSTSTAVLAGAYRIALSMRLATVRCTMGPSTRYTAGVPLTSRVISLGSGQNLDHDPNGRNPPANVMLTAASLLPVIRTAPVLRPCLVAAGWVRSGGARDEVPHREVAIKEVRLAGADRRALREAPAALPPNHRDLAYQQIRNTRTLRNSTSANTRVLAYATDSREIYTIVLTAAADSPALLPQAWQDVQPAVTTILNSFRIT